MEFSMAFINSDLGGRVEYCASFKDQICSQLCYQLKLRKQVSMLLIHGLFVQSCELQNTLDSCSILSLIHFCIYSYYYKTFVCPSFGMWFHE